MIIDSGVVTGSLTVQGPIYVTGSINTTGGITGSFSGTATSASYVYSSSLDGGQNTRLNTIESVTGSYASTSSLAASNTRITQLESVTGSYNSTSSFNSFTSSYNTASSSLSTRVTNTESTGSSLTTASSSFSTRVTATEATASSLTTASSSFSSRITNAESTGSSLTSRVTLTESTASALTTASASFSIRTTNNESTGSSLTTASGSFSTRVTATEATASAYVTTSGSLSTRVTNTEATSSTLTTASSSFSTRVTATEATASTLTTASSSFSSRVAIIESKYATTGSNSFNGSQTITGSITATGTLTAQTLVVQTVTSSIVYSSGSNVFGNTLSNTQVFTGSLYQTGSTAAFMGSVGVGTASPTDLLHIEGTNAFMRVTNPSTGEGGIKISYQNSNTHGLHLLYNPGSAIAYIDNTYPTSSGQVYGDIHIRQNVSGSMTPRIVIKATSGNVGIGTMSPTNLLHVYGTDGNSYVRWTSDVATTGARIGYNSTEFRIDQQQNADITFRTNGSERMRITSAGNVGIGTTSPSAKLNVSGITSGTSIRTDHTSDYSFLYSYINGASSIAFDNIGGNLAFYVNEAYRLRLNTSGNLGLGVTPSAWGIYKAYQVGYGAIASYNDADTVIFSNAYFDGGTWRYIGSSYASQYRQLNSVHSWHTAPSGTAGDAISFTQAMTLLANGNLLVGTTTDAGYKLDVNGTGRFSSSINATIGGFSNYISIGGTSGLTTYGIINVPTGEKMQLNSYHGLDLKTSGGVGSGTPISVFDVTSAGAATFASTVNINAAAWLQFNGVNALLGEGTNTYLQANGGGSIIFRNNAPSELMRITNGGNLGLGTTSPSNTAGFTNQFEISGLYPSINLYGSSANKKWVLGVGGAGDFGIWDNNNSTYAMFITSARNIGIGTTTPTSKLEIIGNTSNAGGYADGAVQISGTGSPLAFVGQSNLNPSLNRWGFKLRSNADGDFSIYSYTNSADRLLINSSGNVGINTTSPTYVLDVRQYSGQYWNGSAFTGTPTAIAMSNTVPGGYDAVFLMQQTDSGGTVKNAGAIGMVGTAAWAAGNNATQTSDMYFLVRNSSGGISERMRIKSDGNVGIGTTSPSQKLTIQGNGAKMLIQTASDPSVYYTSIESNYDSSNTFNIIDGGSNKFGSKALVTYNDTYINSYYNVYIATGTSTNNNASNIRLFVTSGGNVGIGTTSPSRRLHVATGGYFLLGGNGNTSYVSDGLFGASATPNRLGGTGYAGTYGNEDLLLGYYDNGNGLYSPAYGFNVKSTDGRPVAGQVVPAIVMRDTDTNEWPFLVYNNGNINIFNTFPTINLIRSNNSTTASGVIKWKTANDTLRWNIGTNSLVGAGFEFNYGSSNFGYITSGGNWLIGTTTDASHKLALNGRLGITSSGSTTHQVVTGVKTAATSGSAVSIAYVGHTNAVRIHVYIYQSTAHVGMGIADIATAYGSASGGLTTSSRLGNVSSFSVSYNNSGYYIDVLVNYSGAAPTIYWSIEGINNDANIYAL